MIDIVIDQRPEQEVATALEHLRSMADRRAIDWQRPVLPIMYVRENLPPEISTEPAQEQIG